MILSALCLGLYYGICWIYWHYFAQRLPLTAPLIGLTASVIRGIGYRQVIDGKLVRKQSFWLAKVLDDWLIGKEASVFLSYRRDSGDELARLLKKGLEAEGIDCFLDVDDLGASHFDDRLLREIEKRANFIVILSQGALDRCINENDWLRKEITHAIKTKRNIVPIIIPDFTETIKFPSSEQLPREIAELPRYNSVVYSHEYYDKMMEKLLRFLS